jgi:tagatose 1,6-diphosphate aldolase
MTPGKLKSLEAVSDENGIIRAAAMDQRGSLQKSIAKAKGIKPEDLPRKDMEDFKIEVTRALTPHASAILLDPEFGLPASRQRAPGSGLLLAYEVTGYDNAVKGRMPSLLPDYTVKRLKDEGADCVKLLLYYTPFEDESINNEKKEFVKKIGAECQKEDIAFFLEPVGYDMKGGDTKDVSYARLKPEVVKRTTEEFTQDIYAVDVLKVEIPVNLKYTEGAASFNGNEKAYTLDEAKDHYRRAAEAATKPFIYLSAGVSDAEFRENLQVAIDAGVNFSGVLCGRATWKEGIPVFGQKGAKGLADWLQQEGVKNIKALNAVLLKGAKPWHHQNGKKKIQA